MDYDAAKDLFSLLEPLERNIGEGQELEFMDRHCRLVIRRASDGKMVPIRATGSLGMCESWEKKRKKEKK